MLHPIDVASASSLQKDSEFKGFRPSITAILSSAACMDPDVYFPLAMFWHSLAESPRTGLDVLKAVRAVSMGKAARTYGRGHHQICHLQLLKVKLA